MWVKYILLTAAAVFSGVAQAADAVPEAPGRWLYVGPCTLAEDPASAAIPMIASCISARAGAEMIFVSGAPRENFWLRYGMGRGIVTVSEYLSVMAAGSVRDAQPLGELSKENHDRVNDYALIRLGNPAIHHVQLTGGRGSVPFGVNLSHAPESLRMRENREFWLSPAYSAYLTWDNQKNVQLDVGYSTNKTIRSEPIGSGDRDREPPMTDAPHREGAGFRLMTDFSALDGTRLVLSGYGEETGQRRFGLGLLTINSRHDKTHLEFVRLLTTPDGRRDPFRQLVRLAHQSSFRGGGRWILQIDDERFHSRSGSLGHDLTIYEPVFFRMSVTYVKSETGDGLRRWFISTGIEAEI